MLNNSHQYTYTDNKQWIKESLPSIENIEKDIITRIEQRRQQDLSKIYFNEVYIGTVICKDISFASQMVTYLNKQKCSRMTGIYVLTNHHGIYEIYYYFDIDDV